MSALIARFQRGRCSFWPDSVAAKASRADLAQLTLDGQRLTLDVHGLAALDYPLTIDPSIVVTTSAELATGNLEGLLNVTTGALQRPLIGVGLGAATTSTVVLPSARSGHDAVLGNGLVYVTGGLAGSVSLGEVLTAPVGTDGSIGAFTASTNQIDPRSAHASVVYNGVLYVMGGAVAGSSRLFTVQMSKLDAAGLPGPFTATTNLPSARRDFCAAAWKGHLYVAGGDSTVSTLNVQFAPFNPDGTLGSFSSTSALPFALSQHACAVVGDRFYVVGGFAVSMPTGAVYSSPINSDGTLGTFVQTTSIPARGGHRRYAPVFVARFVGEVDVSHLEVQR